MNRKLICILLFLLLLVILMYYFYNKKETFDTKNKKNGMVLILGECFREGNLGSRIRDTDFGLRTQKKASESHIDFSTFVKNKYNIDIDICIHTYKTKYKPKLMQWYGKLLKKINIYPTIFKNINELYNTTCNSIIRDLDKYDFILITRCDIFIKPYFNTNVFNPDWKKIMFSTQNFNHQTKCGFYNGDPVVNPEIIFIPKKYFYILNEKFYDVHWTWGNLKKKFNLTNNDMGFMIDSLHNSNTLYDKNPIYYMVSRNENKTTLLNGVKFDVDNSDTINKYSCKTRYWV